MEALEEAGQLPCLSSIVQGGYVKRNGVLAGKDVNFDEAEGSGLL